MLVLAVAVAAAVVAVAAVGAGEVEPGAAGMVEPQEGGFLMEGGFLKR